MKFEILHGPGNATARVEVGQSETLVTEGGALIAMRGNFSINTLTHDRAPSLLRGLKRRLVGESFFLNYYTGRSAQGEIILSSAMYGDMTLVDIVPGRRLIVEAGSFVCASDRVDLDLSWQGFKSIFSGERLLWISLSGAGQVALSSFGAVYQIDINASEYLVDTGHIVAFDDTLSFSIVKSGKSWMSSFLGGEGLACRFKGQGRLWCQSHRMNVFGQAVSPFLRRLPGSTRQS